MARWTDLREDLLDLEVAVLLLLLRLALGARLRVLCIRDGRGEPSRSRCRRGPFGSSDGIDGGTEGQRQESAQLEAGSVHAT